MYIMYNESSEKLKSSEFIDILFSLLNEDILSFFLIFLNI